MSSANLVTRRTKTIEDVEFKNVNFNELVEADVPCIIKGAAHQSHLVKAGRQSDDSAMAYLLSIASDHPVLNYVTQAPGGRFFYNKAMDGFNFTRQYVAMTAFFEKIKSEKTSPTGTAFYVGSAELANYFPGLLGDEALTLSETLFQSFPARAGIWLGNRTTVAPHYDMSNNIAVNMVGRRRFTLFPPDQIANLYPGPLEPTPGGQVVSLFDINSPDFSRFPRAREALAHAEIAELEPGDALVYPAMWWHQVEALADFNVMINFWWNVVPDYIDYPMHTLLHGLLSLRERPEHERKAWRELFDFYVFGDSETAREHLSDSALGPLAPLDEMAARKLRIKLLKKINR